MRGSSAGKANLHDGFLTVQSLVHSSVIGAAGLFTQQLTPACDVVLVQQCMCMLVQIG